ncbi:aldehyde ferredoxin oxidoreductase [Chromatiales bacterium (ex Bugula neritina AB1)]|nr:aldehyde ferredoxin oxidoreductase [Chromatiales bacterium (ex Bugula neritina AB1)]
MRTYCHIDLSDQTVKKQQLHGEEIITAGRHFIAKSLLELGAATVDPLSADNPLIFSAGPFAGTNFSNANRTSVGCKSPLTGGIKESNSGGTFSFALGQLELAGFTLYNNSDDWVIIHFCKDGSINFESADAFMGMGNFETAEKLHEKYGKKVSIGLCGPVGEYEGLLAGIAFSDIDLRPSRLSARGGVGAVMGNKKVKAIIVDLHKMPQFHERKKLMGAVREYNKMLKAEPAIDNFAKTGTAMMSDVINQLGGIPVRNFTAGAAAEAGSEFKLSGDYLREQNIERGGETTHACMPGCLIQCSNVYADADGNEVVSPIEYETIGLLGTNCGITEPDDLARINWLANDLGVDTIELGGTLGVLMDATDAEFGDVEFMEKIIDIELRQGTEHGRVLAQGAARVGEHYKLQRVPVIKKQTISAYDPRVIEVTGLTMMMTAQGADHTAGNLPTYECQGKDTEELVHASLDMQAICASTDSLGLCIFGRSVTNVQTEFMVNALNDAHGTSLTADFFRKLGVDTLRYENEFNDQAGFNTDDDELPDFFYEEALAPANKLARFHAPEVRQSASRWWEQNPPS